MYFESGLLFDDTPEIFSQTQDNKFTGINIPQSDITVEKHELWNNKEHMASKNSAIDRSQIYKDVYYVFFMYIYKYLVKLRWKNY